tara:strand:- start:253 stop:510 length:258 start_codon:yes stop_codon:yes gene_type:complete
MAHSASKETSGPSQANQPLSARSLEIQGYPSENCLPSVAKTGTGNPKLSFNNRRKGLGYCDAQKAYSTGIPSEGGQGANQMLGRR